MDKIAKLKDFVGPSGEPSSPSKRARSGAHVASCLVDGCDSDLSKCRDYHRRHKVCEAHSKTPIVTICGHQQRFCQQCSRFHSLGEFDNEKRSCRKRLDGHNRRRRKPQPDSLTLNTTFHQGTRFPPFHSPQMFPSSALAMSSNSESDTWRYSSQSTMFARTEYPSHSALSLSHLQSDVAASCGAQRAFFSDWSSNCALSLLSSTSPPSSAQAQNVQAQAQNIASSIRSSSGLGVQNDNASQDYMFRIGPDGSSSSSGPNHHYRLPH